LAFFERIGRIAVTSLGAAAFFWSTMPATADALRCAQLTRISLDHANVISADPVKAGGFKTSGGKALSKLQAFCRVVGQATPTSDSDIRFEVWLPEQGWNGRLWGVGSGYFAGSISQPALGKRMIDGYVAVATDTGHQTRDLIETAWAVGHPQKMIDFGYRGIHEALVNAKRIASAFYGHPPSKAYFGSCSNGGRQGAHGGPALSSGLRRNHSGCTVHQLDGSLHRER